MNYVKVLNTALWWSITLLVSSFYIYQSNIYGKYGMMVLTGIIAGLCILRYGKNLNFRITTFHLSVFIFAMFCFISTLWSVLPQESIKKAMSVFQILICMSVVYVYAAHQSSILPLLDSVRWAGYLMAIYLLSVYGLDHIQYLLTHSARIDSELINSNLMGKILSFSLILTMYRWLFYGSSLSYLFAIPEIILFGVINSRTALLGLVFGLVAVVYIKCAKKNLLTKILGMFLGGVMLFALIWAITSLSIFEGLKHRMEGLFALFTDRNLMDYSTAERSMMFKAGISQFLETPFLGIGIGSSSSITWRFLGISTYLHNNYVELLATIGFLGTVSYYQMFLIPGIKFIRSLKSGNVNTRICLILLLLSLLIDMGSVSYYFKGTYFMLLIFFVQMKFIDSEDSHDVAQN